MIGPAAMPQVTEPNIVEVRHPSYLSSKGSVGWLTSETRLYAGKPRVSTSTRKRENLCGADNQQGRPRGNPQRLHALLSYTQKMI